MVILGSSWSVFGFYLLQYINLRTFYIWIATTELAHWTRNLSQNLDKNFAGSNPDYGEINTKSTKLHLKIGVVSILESLCKKQFRRGLSPTNGYY